MVICLPTTDTLKPSVLAITSSTGTPLAASFFLTDADALSSSTMRMAADASLAATAFLPVTASMSPLNMPMAGATTGSVFACTLYVTALLPSYHTTSAARTVIAPKASNRAEAVVAMAVVLFVAFLILLFI